MTEDESLSTIRTYILKKSTRTLCTLKGKTIMGIVPETRIVRVNKLPINETGRFVVYWMTAFRRMSWNFALQRASDWAREMQKGLLIVEVIPLDSPWVCDRFHRFQLDGVHDNVERAAISSASYYPLVEQSPGEAERLLLRLSRSAAVIVTDDFPSRDCQSRIASAGARLSVLFEKVDSNGLLPIHSTDRVFARAFDFRRYLQKELPLHLLQLPLKDPLPETGELPDIDLQDELSDGTFCLDPSDNFSNLPIDHRVGPTQSKGGSANARIRLRQFLKEKLPLYSATRNQPGRETTSGLSPYLHFGHISTHEVFAELMHQEEWSPVKLSSGASGKKSGWWNLGEDAEAFLDELITWRELGYNMASKQPDFDQYRSLPRWARETLSEHSNDERPYVYAMEQFEGARSHDPLWNAAQRELVEEGRIHNYLRMLWGKKILEWSRSPEEAFQVMVELNNRYALDGNDPNSYSGISWVLGRYDRPWGPERPIFGKIRYMSSENTARKLDVRPYLERYSSFQKPLAPDK